MFDDIVPIPFQDTAKHDKWKVQNRWKIYHATPYEETTFGADTTQTTLQTFGHYAFRIYNESSQLKVDFYKNLGRYPMDKEAICGNKKCFGSYRKAKHFEF